MILITILAGLGAFASGLFALFIWTNGRKTTSSQIFHTLLSEFKSPEMLMALRRLYDLKKQCDDQHIDIALEYKRIMREEDSAIEKAEPINRPHLVAVSLHHQRRIVSNFFYYIHTVVKNSMISRTIVYKYWTMGNISLIREVLVPIGVDNGKYLMELVVDAQLYFRRERLSMLYLGIGLISASLVGTMAALLLL
jgi:hypothetical protein